MFAPLSKPTSQTDKSEETMTTTTANVVSPTATEISEDTIQEEARKRRKGILVHMYVSVHPLLGEEGYVEQFKIYCKSDQDRDDRIEAMFDYLNELALKEKDGNTKKFYEDIIKVFRAQYDDPKVSKGNLNNFCALMYGFCHAEHKLREFKESYRKYKERVAKLSGEINISIYTDEFLNYHLQLKNSYLKGNTLERLKENDYKILKELVKKNNIKVLENEKESLMQTTEATEFKKSIEFLDETLLTYCEKASSLDGKDVAFGEKILDIIARIFGALIGGLCFGILGFFAGTLLGAKLGAPTIPVAGPLGLVITGGTMSVGGLVGFGIGALAGGYLGQKLAHKATSSWIFKKEVKLNPAEKVTDPDASVALQSLKQFVVDGKKEYEGIEKNFLN